MAFVYIVECADGTFYTGWALDVTRRVEAHNAGRGARYTRAHGPVRLVYAEECASRVDAQRRETAIKRLPRAAKQALIATGPSAAARRRKGSGRKICR